MKRNQGGKKTRTHSFCIEDAERYGIKEAILLANIRHWLDKNKANRSNIHDGRVWTYNSGTAFQELFPYMTAKQIRTALSKLIEAGVLVTGNYNRSAYDRTLWYSIEEPEYLEDGEAETGSSIVPKGPIHLTERDHPFALEGEPIPDINTDRKPDSKHKLNGAVAPDELSGILGRLIEQWNGIYGVKVRATGKKKQQLRQRLRTFTLPEIMMAISNRARDPWLKKEGIQYRGDWDAFFRNDERVERYLNAKRYEEEDEDAPLF